MDKTGWPAWMRDGYALLWACEGGREWDEAVVKWTELERAYGMVNSTTPLPKRGRPEAIDKWVKGGRSAKAPEIVLDKHSKTWWSWWTGMAPSWRELDDNGRPVIGKSGPWEDLVKPGGNGLLTAMLCLVWWLGAAGEVTQEWEAAVTDVKWVLEGLAAEAKTAKYVYFIPRC
ncbi:hypothetical protein B0H14DRAFT_2378828 [Mycena olivaceomarginata]|nr:hypothetical protein B0H14DRAFT_2378828 [Mycena olivaceomarginata]